MVGNITQEKEPKGSKEETLTKVIEVLLDALDPARLSLESFDLATYFDPLLKSIGEKFKISRIILRYEDRFEKDQLDPLATFGFDKDQVRKLTSVTKESSMAQYMASIESCYYARNLFGDDTKFDQKAFAEELDLKSAFACPLFLRGTFVGFIIYYKSQVDGFDSSERQFLEKLNNIIQTVFVFAENINRSSNQFVSLSRDYSSALASLLISFHDAKNYLALGIRMTTKARKCAETAPSNPELKKRTLKYLDFALNRSNQAQELVLEVLRGEQRRFSEIGNLRNLIEEAIAPIRSQLRGISLNVSSNDSRPTSLIGNSRQLRQVFFNIIYNSYRATVEAIDQKVLRTRGIIDISLSHDNERVFVEITDNGIGIEEGRLTNLFSKLESTWKDGTGTGIGLSLCKKIIGLHCGNITITSEYLRGTTVQIEMPKNLKVELER